jgi:hypothetical protein
LNLVKKKMFMQSAPRNNRFNAWGQHAATIVGRKMLVTGGNTASGSTNDVQILHLGKMMWSGIVEAGPSTPTQGGMPKSVRRQRLPACKGHSMVRQKKTFFIVKIGHFDEQTQMVEWLKSEKAYFRWTERSRSHALLKFRAGF